MMHARSPLLAVMLSTLLVVGCSSDDDDSSAPAPTDGSSGGDATPIDATMVDLSVASFEAVDCATLTSSFVVENDLLGDGSTTCGQVSVPADWSTPSGNRITLAVYRIPSTSQTPAADPVVYLEGGPGGAGVGIVAEFSNGDSAYLRNRSEIIVLDQRGTGYSVPALYCSEIYQAEANDGDEESAYRACHDRFVAEGVSFADYNSRNNALDVAAARQAMGIDSWNLYGLSYGTRLALTVMRDRPEGVRSVVLDSVFPPEVNGFSEADYPYYFSIEQITSNCMADTDCNINIPQMQASIEQGIERLETQPIEGLSADAFVEFLGESIADEDVASTIVTIATGTDEELLAMVQSMDGDAGDDDGPSPADVDASLYPFVADVADAMFAAVTCAEEAAYLESKAGPDIAAQFANTTQTVVNRVADFESFVSLCQIFSVPPGGEIETQAVTSSVPTLVLAGTADLQTPPAWSLLADESLPNSQYAEFAGLTHGLIGNNACLNQITLAFLADPSSAASQACIVDLPGVDYDTE